MQCHRRGCCAHRYRDYGKRYDKHRKPRHDNSRNEQAKTNSCCLQLQSVNRRGRHGLFKIHHCRKCSKSIHHRISGIGSDCQCHLHMVSHLPIEHFSCRCSVGSPYLWAFSAMKPPLHSPYGLPGNRENALKTSTAGLRCWPRSRDLSTAIRGITWR